MYSNLLTSVYNAEEISRRVYSACVARDGDSERSEHGIQPFDGAVERYTPPFSDVIGYHVPYTCSENDGMWSFRIHLTLIFDDFVRIY